MQKKANVNQSTIRNIKENFESMETEIVNKLYFKTPHGGTIGRYRETTWGDMFEKIIPRKFEMLFPHIAYAEMFDKNGKREGDKNE